jgi:hypothetical protein
LRRGGRPYHLLVPIALKSGSLDLLEPSGPLQAYNWNEFLGLRSSVFLQILAAKTCMHIYFFPIRAVRPPNVFSAEAETCTTLSWPPILKMLFNMKFSGICYEDHDTPKAQNRSGDLCYPLNARDCQNVW